MSDGTGRIYKRGSTWWIDYSFRGERHREPTGSTLKKVATTLLRKRMAEMGRGRIVGPDQERLTFDDLATIITNEYEAKERKSANRLEVSLKALRSFFGTARALDITTRPCGRLHRVQTQDGPSEQHDPQRGERAASSDGAREESGQAR